MNKIIKDDLYRYIGNKCNNIFWRLRYIYFTPGFQYIYFFRHVQISRNVISRAFWHICLKSCSFKFGFQIPPCTKIGKGFRIIHFGAIVINPKAIIGKNFNISQGTLIGYASGKREGTPTIGDNVCMNANSSIVGNVKIGNNVLIAPGAFINFDVPDNSIVIGNPGQIIRRENSPTDKYIVYKLN